MRLNNIDTVHTFTEPNMTDANNKILKQKLLPTQPNRRRFMGLVGGGIVVCASPLISGCSTELPAAAVAAWKLPSDNIDLRRYILAHALLAPNPHNRQPWLADLRKPNEITLVCDKNRLLPETDPYGRQIIVGCGAFIELAVMAAAHRGYRIDVKLFPDGEPEISKLPGGSTVARLVLVPDATLATNPLFTLIALRRTNKGVYDNARVIPQAQWDQFMSAGRDFGLQAGAVTGTNQIQSVRDIARSAYDIETLTPRTWLESGRLLRIGPDAIEKNRDGISINGIMPRLLTTVGLFDPLEVPIKGDSNHKRMIDRWASFETGSGYFWLASESNSRKAQINSGRAYLRAQLMATAAGLSMHPLSQALQEFTEAAAPYQAIHRLLGFDPASHTLQMLARVGYPIANTNPSPRRELDSLIEV